MQINLFIPLSDKHYELKDLMCNKVEGLTSQFYEENSVFNSKMLNLISEICLYENSSSDYYW